ncbi:MAG: hypothetical protein WKF47_17845 [Geodermatophilaceae bacterium]
MPDPSENELMDYCRRSLARFKSPSAVTFVAELPHSVTGKVSRARLRELGLDVTRTVTLLTRKGCHLCDEARPALAAICAETGAELA